MSNALKLFSLISLFILNSGLFSTSWADTPDNNILRLATTTSTENSDLLKYLLPNFEKQTGYTVHVIAVGTGKALRMGKDGDFVIVGPDNDPAKLKKAKTIAEAMANELNAYTITDRGTWLATKMKPIGYDIKSLIYAS